MMLTYRSPDFRIGSKARALSMALAPAGEPMPHARKMALAPIHFDYASWATKTATVTPRGMPFWIGIGRLAGPLLSSTSPGQAAYPFPN